MQQEPVNCKVLQFRLFRLRHGIPLRDIAIETGISLQRISQIELAERHVKLDTQNRLANAIETVLLQKQQKTATALEDYYALRGHLFEEASKSEVKPDGST